MLDDLDAAVPIGPTDSQEIPVQATRPQAPRLSPRQPVAPKGCACSHRRRDLERKPLQHFLPSLRRALSRGHDALALIGVAVALACAVVALHPGLRDRAEGRFLVWLQERHEVRAAAQAPAESEPGENQVLAALRATLADPATLTAQQAAVAQWLARRYKLAHEPLARLVQEAWHSGDRTGVDPTLILALVAVESSFNPFAQGSAGERGLMQVAAHDHEDKFEAFGGLYAAFDPLANLRVGALVLQESIRRAGGSLSDGLKLYLAQRPQGDLATPGTPAGRNPAPAAERVFAEQTRLREIVRAVPREGEATRVAMLP